MEKFVQPAIPKFDGHYEFWSMTMENFLRSKEMWQIIQEGILLFGTHPTEAQAKAEVDATLKDLKVKNYLFQAIDREILDTILDKSTSKKIWQSMQQKFQGSTRVKRAQLQALRREFELLTMKDAETIDQYLGRTLSTVNKMKSNGEVMDSMLKISHDSRSETGYNRGSGGGFSRGGGGYRGGGGRGRGSGRGRQSLNKALVECFQCHKLGHFQYECPRLEKQAYYAMYEESSGVEDEILLVAYEETNHVQQEDWFLDSG
ncbi:uncharacterized protein LOC108336842 [Vigna angularis]|uniref:uncharacterized protein LOC108336842 n=1 Tax=Phaseolus angularis TaxID=3914 RepID=UPI000809F152|nr:uncharacterized protein LOC108336842 [Vigna angularis]